MRCDPKINQGELMEDIRVRIEGLSALCFFVGEEAHGESGSIYKAMFLAQKILDEVAVDLTSIIEPEELTP